MIELPEAVNLAGQIKKHLTGKTVVKVTANKSPHGFAWFNSEPAGYHTGLVKKTITGTNAYGGYTHSVVCLWQSETCSRNCSKSIKPAAPLV